MTSNYNYYFDSDERDYSVKPPKMTAEEIDEMNNNDENWFKYMMNKEPIVYQKDNKNYTTYTNYNTDAYTYPTNDDNDSLCDSEDYDDESDESDEYDM